jgi:hypothetical protein
VNFGPLLIGNNCVLLKREEIKFSVSTISRLYDELWVGCSSAKVEMTIDEELFPFYAFYQMEYKEQKIPVLHPKLCIDNFLLNTEIAKGVDVATFSIIFSSW